MEFRVHWGLSPVAPLSIEPRPILTVVMYHYVRDLPRTRYPAIKGLQVERFEGQLDYICRHYTVVGFKDVVAAFRGEASLPIGACALTFDDGFVDHYVEVFPRLRRRGLVGSFYPPASVVERRKVLDVHKLHFVLATVADARQLAGRVGSLTAEYRDEYAIPADADLWVAHALTSRYDPPEIVFVKRLLQRGLPAPVRSAIVDKLFREFVTSDEGAFASELYMDLAKLQDMATAGMEIGGHGDEHLWLETLEQDEQRAEIEGSCRLLAAVHGQPPAQWVMCYPYGSYNKVTLGLLRDAGCAVGLTTKVGLVTSWEAPLELTRLDTNDLPCARDATVCEWTRRA